MTIRLQKVLMTLVLALAFASTVKAQTPKVTVPNAPLPAQIVAAKKVFISYAGGESGQAGYSGESDRTYNQFYAAIKAWGQYEIVPTPAAADLVFEIGFINPFKDVTRGYSETDTQFRFVIRDPKSNVLLWTLYQHVLEARTAGNRDKNFDQGMDYLLDDIKRLVGPPIPERQNSSK
jgi:hypothetical protein